MTVPIGKRSWQRHAGKAKAFPIGKQERQERPGQPLCAHCQSQSMLVFPNNLCWENNPLLEEKKKPIFWKITTSWASSQGQGSTRGHAAKAMASPHACSQGHDSLYGEAATAKRHNQIQDSTHGQGHHGNGT